jgi:site-specific recombinase XerD
MTNNTDTQGAAMTLEKGLAAFLDAMLGKNRSAATLRAYRTDILQFMAFLHENNVAITEVGDVGKVDVLEYLAALAKKGLTGVARARKVSAIREYFRYLEGVGVIQKSPTAGIDTPKREKHTRQYLRSDEYTKMLSLAGGNPRDYAILQVFLQTGIRVSELAHLALADIDLTKPAIIVRGKGSIEREIALEKRGVQAAGVIGWVSHPGASPIWPGKVNHSVACCTYKTMCCGKAHRTR